MNDHKIRHEARDANRHLELGPHPNLQSIQYWLETQRGKPITIVELPTLRGNDLCGLWVSYEGCDVVVHAPPESAWQQQQIVLHEFAHMILNHQLTATSLELVHLPSLPENPTMMLGRSSFEDDAEAAAEYLADLLMARILPRLQDLPDDPSGFNKVFG